MVTCILHLVEAGYPCCLVSTKFQLSLKWSIFNKSMFGPEPARGNYHQVFPMQGPIALSMLLASVQLSTAFLPHMTLHHIAGRGVHDRVSISRAMRPSLPLLALKASGETNTALSEFSGVDASGKQASFVICQAKEQRAYLTTNVHHAGHQLELKGELVSRLLRCFQRGWQIHPDG